MAQLHTSAAPISHGVDSSAYWALQPSGRVLLFVHGFNGHATRTWLQFPWRLPLVPEFQRCDYVFFGYDSRQPADDSAWELVRFIDALIDPQFTLINHSLRLAGYPLRGGDTFACNKLTLVAHSLGACVSRRALLLNIYNVRKPWSIPIQLVLFAPAHKGAKLLDLVLETGLPFKLGDLAVAVGKWKIPVFADLRAGSDFLRDLETDTRKAFDEKHDHLRASRVLRVHKDAVVTETTFAYDDQARRIDGRNHVSICKPERGFMRPINELENLP